jgi:hypothetical protein
MYSGASEKCERRLWMKRKKDKHFLWLDISPCYVHTYMESVAVGSAYIEAATLASN